MKSFEAVYGRHPAATGSASGRVNVLGSHTDYHDGLVLYAGIPQTIAVAGAPGLGPVSRISIGDDAVIDGFPDTAATGSAGEPAARAQRALRRAAQVLACVDPLDVCVSSEFPADIGLGHAAALQVAMLRMLCALVGRNADEALLLQLELAAEGGEPRPVHTLPDALASLLAAPERMLFVDARTRERVRLPLPAGSEVLVVDSGIPRTLAATAGRVRREETRRAAQSLGKQSLRDVTDPGAAEDLPPPLFLRTRHVVTENARVLEASRGVGAAKLGQLMNDSHSSLRDDYEVSVTALDQLVELLQSDSAVYGARVAGEGFGGSCIALCREGMAQAVGERVLGAYNHAGGVARVLVPRPTLTETS